jgi:hypothetical protein
MSEGVNQTCPECGSEKYWPKIYNGVEILVCRKCWFFEYVRKDN